MTAGNRFIYVFPVNKIQKCTEVLCMFRFKVMDSSRLFFGSRDIVNITVDINPRKKIGR